MKGKLEQGFEFAVRLVNHREDLSQLQAAADRLHPQMILLIDHETQTLRGIHDNCAANALGGMLTADQMPFHKNLLFQWRERFQIL